MLTIYIFLPLLGASLVAFAIAADFDLIPLWFKASTLPLSLSIEMAAFTLALVWVFYSYEKYILYDPIEAKKVFNRVVATTITSAFFLVMSSFFGFEMNFRELSQDLSMNVFYNLLRVLIVFFYFGLIGTTKQGVLIFCIAIGYFNAFSGSKGSMLTPLLIALTVTGRPNGRSWLILVSVLVALLWGLIPLAYTMRYFDPAFSAYQTAFIHYNSGIDLMSYYIQLIKYSLSGIKGYNPVMVYLNDTNLAAGYNLTPTIVGELMGSGTTIGLLILLFINFYLWSIKRLWLRRGPIGMKYFASGLFVLGGTLQSSFMDVVFFIVYFFIALGVVKILNLGLSPSLHLKS